jgi:hypothetical protein
MENSIRRSPSARKANPASKAALGRYLAAGLGATGLASVDSEAGIVNVDITNIGSTNLDISGPNAGIPLGSSPSSIKNIVNFPVTNGAINVANFDYPGSYVTLGFYKGSGPAGGPGANYVTQFATGGTAATPFRFTEAGISSVGPTLPSGTVWSDNRDSAPFRSQAYYGAPLVSAPDWGAGSYIGFRTRPTGSQDPQDWTYGYFEVTWTNATNTFEVLSGAYESTLNTPIAVAVPEPTGLALAGIGALALGAGAIRRSRKARKARKAAAEGSLAEAV